MNIRKSISNDTKQLLWAMSAGRCEKCGRLLYRHPLSDTVGNFAQIAHNLPVSEFGPRTKFKFQVKEIDPNLNVDDVNNLLLLCYDCHREIDQIKPDEYPPDKLKRIKDDFERFVVKATNIQRIVPTIAIKYSPNLHGQKLLITGIQRAIFPDKFIDCEIDLTLKNSSFDIGGANYWSIEEEHLVGSFREKVKPILEDYQRCSNNLSVFAIGPIPLLIKFGTLLSNKNNIDVYQLKKSPASTWEWESSKDDFDYKVNVIQQSETTKRTIVLFSISGCINQMAVRQAISWDEATVIEVTTTCLPHDDLLRSKQQLDKFVNCYRKLKEQLLGLNSNRRPLHIFAAVPVSVAVEIGRHWNPTIDLPMVIYNLTNGNYEKALTIGVCDE